MVGWLAGLPASWLTGWLWLVGVADWRVGSEGVLTRATLGEAVDGFHRILTYKKNKHARLKTVTNDGIPVPSSGTL